MDGLVTLRTVTSHDDEWVSYPAYRDLRDEELRATPGVFESVAATSVRRFTLRLDAGSDPRTAEPTWGAMTSANYFDVLGVRPVVGRTFLPDEDRDGGGSAVVVISHSLWQRRFDGSPEVSASVSGHGGEELLKCSQPASRSANANNGRRGARLRFTLLSLNWISGVLGGHI
jgi:hypothetical protein